MTVKLLTEQLLELLSLKGGCTDLSESFHVKMPRFWKSHVAAHLLMAEQGLTGVRCITVALYRALWHAAFHGTYITQKLRSATRLILSSLVESTFFLNEQLHRQSARSCILFMCMINETTDSDRSKNFSMHYKGQINTPLMQLLPGF